LLEFLYIEHHAKLQAALAHFAMPYSAALQVDSRFWSRPSKTVTAAPAACDDIDRFGHELRLAAREEAAE
jgi:hypothetical protein